MWKPQLNIRMLLVFFMVAAALNIVNYLFFALKEQPSTRPSRFNLDIMTSLYAKPTATLKAKPIRITKIIPSRSVVWEVLLTCTSNSTNNSTTSSLSADDTYKYTESSFSSGTVANNKQLCPELPPGLGHVDSEQGLIDAAQELISFANVLDGGFYTPPACKPRQRAAVIVAHRGQNSSLNNFILYLHAFLMKQQLEYQIFVVEDANQTVPYKRGHLFNIGFSEVHKLHGAKGWSCLILHEAYVWPADLRNLYRCSWYPKQLMTSLERPHSSHRTLHRGTFGGAISINSEQFVKINGFSNVLWKNNLDNEDFHRRILAANYTLEEASLPVGLFRSSIYQRSFIRSKSDADSVTLPPLYLIDGLSTLSYEVDKIVCQKHFTLIIVTSNRDKTQSENSENYILESILSRVLHRTTVS